MPIANVIDHRKHSYRFMKINVVVEAAWHDNSCINSDQVELDSDNEGPDYAEREHISLEEAIAWGTSFPNLVTLYIYDEDGGIYPSMTIGEESEMS